MSDTLVVEIAPFAVADGVAEQRLLEASERLEREFLAGRQGYVGRVLARLDGGQWADIVLWRSPQDVEAAMGLVGESAACSAYFSCMAGADHDAPGHGISLFRAVRVYGSLAA